MKLGQRTPWGKAQDITGIGEGLWWVSTASHGGVKLDAKRNRLIPQAARMPGGWYEEDCKWAIAAHVLPEVEAMICACRKTIEATLRRYESAESLKSLGLAP